VLHPVTASRVAAGAPPPDEHRRITTAFLAVPPVDPDDLRDFVVAATDTVVELDGDVLQCTGGDKGILLIAVFGVPVAHPDDPSRAVHAVERLRSRTDVPFAAGISTGLAFTAAFGGATRRFASVLGDTANLAARLMAAAAPGMTLVDAPTAAESGALLGETRLIAVKNRVEPVDVAVVEGLAAGGDFTAEGETPLVGRATELAAAERLLDAGSGALHLVGEAGSGKSRLAAEVVRRARVRGLPVRAGRFASFGGGRPLAPFLAMVDAADIERVRPGDEALAPLLDDGLADSPATSRLSPEERAELTRRLVADLLAASPGPIVVEDLHWADGESWALLRELDTSAVPVLTTSREAHDLPGHTMQLGDLPDDDLRTLARDTWSRLGGVDLPAEYVDTLVERSTGSPRFAQTVTELARRGYRPGVPLPEVPFPDQLLPFLTARLDALGDDAQATALRLAVLGRPARPAGLAEVFGLDGESAAQDIGLLADAGIARDAGGGYVELRQAAVGRALLDRASHADREPLHARVCGYLIGIGASPRDVAAHLEHCDLPALVPDTYRRARDEAAGLWLLAEARRWAELALARGDEDDAVALAELEQQLGLTDAAEGRLRELSGPDVERLLGRIAFETGRPAEAVEHLLAAERAGAEGAGIEWPLTMALCDLGRFGDARDRAEALLVADDPWVRLDALANLGVVEARDGRLDRAAEALEAARPLAADLGDTLRLAHVTGDLAGARFMAGRVGEAAALLDEAAELAERLGARRLVAMVLGNVAHVRVAGGDFHGAVRAAVASADARLGIGDVGLALDILQTPIDVAEIRGERELAARWWREHALLEERLGRPHDCAISWFRHAAVSGEAASMASAEAAAEGLDTGDLTLHRARAEAALAGDYTLPPEAETAAVELPPLDANLPAATPEIVDELFARLAVRLDHLTTVHV
jgi:tetratricopeptide (TPR) repeat protein